MNAIIEYFLSLIKLCVYIYIGRFFTGIYNTMNAIIEYFLSLIKLCVYMLEDFLQAYTITMNAIIEYFLRLIKP